MRTIEEYEGWLARQHNVPLLRAEALERCRVNVGLISENTELKRRVRKLEEGIKLVGPMLDAEDPIYNHDDRATGKEQP